jgi:mono/diheme cytochrome c family protein
VLHSRWFRGAAVVGAVFSMSSVALGMPWDLDMVDSLAVKAYEAIMRPLPDGVVSQPSVLSPKTTERAYGHTDPEVAGLVNPLPADQASLDRGEKMYGIYCTPCHGDGQNLGPLSAPGRVPAIPVLTGADGRLHRLTDGWVYVTIRKGSLSQIMPPYGFMMSDTEMWSLVHYLRTMPGSAYVPPAPTETTPAEGIPQ